MRQTLSACITCPDVEDQSSEDIGPSGGLASQAHDLVFARFLQADDLVRLHQTGANLSLISQGGWAGKKKGGRHSTRTARAVTEQPPSPQGLMGMDARPTNPSP